MGIVILHYTLAPSRNQKILRLIFMLSLLTIWEICANYYDHSANNFGPSGIMNYIFSNAFIGFKRIGMSLGIFSGKLTDIIFDILEIVLLSIFNILVNFGKLLFLPSIIVFGYVEQLDTLHNESIRQFMQPLVFIGFVVLICKAFGKIYHAIQYNVIKSAKLF